MRPTTPAEKVPAYRVFVQGFRITALVFVILGITLVTHGLSARILFIAATFFLTTAFASSKSKFAKEVEEAILPFCREKKCGYAEYPITVSQCDKLREDREIFQELTRLATAVIRATEDVDRCWRTKNTLGYRSATVNEYNAKNALRTRWNFYRRVGPVGILPFKNPSLRVEWNDEEDFLESVQLGILSLRSSEEYV